MNMGAAITPWTCHPETRLGWTGFGFKKMLVKAQAHPPKTFVKIKFENKVIALAYRKEEPNPKT